MTGIKLLNNTGIKYIGDENALKLKEKTLIVIGIARSGTSLIAGSLHHLGVFTGKRSKEPVFEDVNLAKALEENDFKQVKDIIEKYNENDVWAFKRPSSIDYVNELSELCRNPIYLIVFKDIFAISNRNSISMKTDFLRGLKKAYNDYEKIVSFVENKNPNAFLFSYEKIMNDKEAFVNNLIDIVGQQNVSAFQKKSVLDFIEPNPRGYLDASRITKSVGKIEIQDRLQVVGWAKYLHSSQVADVELYINDKLIESKAANEVRENDSCGFSFDLKSYALTDKDKVSVKVKDDVVYLNDSTMKNRNSWFTQAQLNDMAMGKYREADFLRDIARILMDRDDMKNASRVIAKALELRPTGPVIIELSQKIERLG